MKAALAGVGRGEAQDIAVAGNMALQCSQVQHVIAFHPQHREKKVMFYFFVQFPASQASSQVEDQVKGYSLIRDPRELLLI